MDGHDVTEESVNKNVDGLVRYSDEDRPAGEKVGDGEDVAVAGSGLAERATKIDANDVERSANSDVLSVTCARAWKFPSLAAEAATDPTFERGVHVLPPEPGAENGLGFGISSNSLNGLDPKLEPLKVFKVC